MIMNKSKNNVNMDGAVLGGDQAGAEALGHGGLKGHGSAV